MPGITKEDAGSETHMDRMRWLKKYIRNYLQAFILIHERLRRYYPVFSMMIPVTREKLKKNVGS
jgi:hypothetical protein